MPPEEQVKIAQQYSKRAPIEIPESAKIKAQSKTGYEQISYKWNDGTYKYEVRWHTRTPGAPETKEIRGLFRGRFREAEEINQKHSLKLEKTNGLKDINGTMRLLLGKREQRHQNKLVF